MKSLSLVTGLFMRYWNVANIKICLVCVMYIDTRINIKTKDMYFVQRKDMIKSQMSSSHSDKVSIVSYVTLYIS